MPLETKEVYKKKGQVEQDVGAIITLIMGVGIAVLMLIFVGVLGGQVYSQTAEDINDITDATIRGHVTASIQSGFEGLELTGGYLPIVALAVIIFIVLGLVLTFGAPSATGRGVGGAL